MRERPSLLALRTVGFRADDDRVVVFREPEADDFVADLLVAIVRLSC